MGREAPRRDHRLAERFVHTGPAEQSEHGVGGSRGSNLLPSAGRVHIGFYRSPVLFEDVLVGRCGRPGQRGPKKWVG